jgi:hypothetical protein
MRRVVFARLALALGAALLLPAAGRAQITLGQTDTFETATTLNWTQGALSPAGALTVVSGGQGGPNDHYMQIVANGAGAGGKITVFNQAQWLGNYNAAGVNAIEMDLLNPSATLLTIRVAFRVNASAASPGYASNNATAFSLAPDGQWHHAVFPLTDASMAPVNSPATSFSTLLNSPGEVRILHSAAPALNGDNIAATLGVDNIRASFLPVPEPAHGLALALAAAGAARLLRRRRRGVTADPGTRG